MSVSRERKYWVIAALSFRIARLPTRRMRTEPTTMGRSPPFSSLGMQMPRPSISNCTMGLGTLPAAMWLIILVSERDSASSA